MEECDGFKSLKNSGPEFAWAYVVGRDIMPKSGPKARIGLIEH